MTTTTVAAATMKVAQITKPGAGFLENADEAYARMMSGKAQFRVVLTM